MRAILIFLIFNENFSDEIEGLIPSDTGELVECEPENVRQVCESGVNPYLIATFYYEEDKGKYEMRQTLYFNRFFLNLKNRINNFYNIFLNESVNKLPQCLRLHL